MVSLPRLSAGLSLFVCERQHKSKPVRPFVGTLDHDLGISIAILKLFHCRTAASSAAI
jgi:hypothetical protein